MLLLPDPLRRDCKAKTLGGRQAEIIPRKFLRKKPPKADDDAAPHTDFTPANDDAWAGTHWHPNRTRVKA